MLNRQTEKYRNAFNRFPAAQQRRMDKLLDKGNAGKLSINEKRELDKLVDEFEERTLQKARAMDAIRGAASWPREKVNAKPS